MCTSSSLSRLPSVCVCVPVCVCACMLCVPVYVCASTYIICVVFACVHVCVYVSVCTLCVCCDAFCCDVLLPMCLYGYVFISLCVYVSPPYLRPHSALCTCSCVCLSAQYYCKVVCGSTPACFSCVRAFYVLVYWV